MRVLIVNPSPIRGGAEQMLETFGLRFDPARVRCEVACLTPGPFVEELRDAGVRVHDVDAGRMRQVNRYTEAVRALARLARETDVVCSWQVKGHYYGTPAARLARKPALWWDHGIRPVRGERSSFAGGFVPRALKADLVLTSSRAAAARHPRARAIHPGIDLEPFRAARSRREAARSSLGVPAEAPLVGIVGRLQPWKGQHVFLRAAAHVAALHPDARFAVVGDAIGGFSADYPRQLRALASELGITDRVVFAGERRDVPDVLAALDVFVHCSVEEPFGIVLIEALAAGVPVVATRGGGVPEIVDDGRSGFLVGVGDEEAIAAHVLRLLSDEPLRRSIVEAGTKRVERLFTADRMVAEMTEVLESFAPRRHHSHA